MSANQDSLLGVPKCDKIYLRYLITALGDTPGTYADISELKVVGLQIGKYYRLVYNGDHRANGNNRVLVNLWDGDAQNGRYLIFQVGTGNNTTSTTNNFFAQTKEIIIQSKTGILSVSAVVESNCQLLGLNGNNSPSTDGEGTFLMLEPINKNLEFDSNLIT